MDVKKPLWALDVDGVVNCFPAPVHSQLMASQDWRDVLVDGYKIWYREDLVSFINRIHDEGLAEILWVTTWTDRARDLLAPALGLGSFAVAPRGPGQAAPGPGWWKWKAVQAHMDSPGAAGRALVWTDDELEGPVRGFATSLYPNRTFLLRPEGNPGLTDEDQEAIEAFLRERREERKAR